MAGTDKVDGSGPKRRVGQKPKSDPKKDAVAIGQQVIATAARLLGDKAVEKYKGQAFKHLSALAEQHLGKDGIGKELADAAIKLLSDATDRLAEPREGLTKEDALIGDTKFKELEGGLFSITGGNASRPSHAIHDLLGIAGLDNKSGFSSTIKDLITGAAKLDLRVKKSWTELGSSILMAALATPGGWQAKLAAAGWALGDGVLGSVEVGVKKKAPKSEGAEATPTNGDAKAEADAKKAVGNEGYHLAPLPTNGEEKAFSPMAAMLGQLITTTQQLKLRTKGEDGTNHTASVTSLRPNRAGVSPSPSKAQQQRGLTKAELAKAKADGIRQELVTADAIVGEVVRLLGGEGGKGADKASQLLMQALQSVDGKDNGPSGADQLSMLLALQRVMLAHAKASGQPAEKVQRFEALAKHTELLQNAFLKGSQAERINFADYSPAFSGLLNRQLLGSVIELVQMTTGLRPGEQLGLDANVLARLRQSLLSGANTRMGPDGKVAFRESELADRLQGSFIRTTRFRDDQLRALKLEPDGPAIELKKDQAAALASGLAQTLGLPEGSAEKVQKALEGVFDGAAIKQRGFLNALSQAIQSLVPTPSASLKAAAVIIRQATQVISASESALRELRPALAQVVRAEPEYQAKVDELTAKLGNVEDASAKEALTKAQADLDRLRGYKKTLEGQVSEIQEGLEKAQSQLPTGLLRSLQEFAKATVDPEAYNAKAGAATQQMEKLDALWVQAFGGGEAASKAAKEILADPEFIALAREHLGDKTAEAMETLKAIAEGKHGSDDSAKNKGTDQEAGRGHRDFASAGKNDGELTIAQQRFRACQEVLADPSLSIQDKMLYFLFIFALYTDKEREASMEEFTKQDKAQADWKANEKTLNQRVDERRTTVEGLEEELKALRAKADEQANTPMGISDATKTEIGQKQEALATANERLNEATKELDKGVKDVGANAKNQDIMFMNLERITQRYTQLLQLINSLLEKSDRLIEKLSR